MSTVREMLPPDMLQYCQEQGLLESVLVPEAAKIPSGDFD
jgi:hypothetical protein